jgi:16S rRNA processing protein RimM
MAVVLADGSDFGTVRAVVNYGAGDILEIDRPERKGDLFAFNHATFPVVDAEHRRITIHPPEILQARNLE